MTLDELVSTVGHKHKYTPNQIKEMQRRLRVYFRCCSKPAKDRSYLYDTSRLLEIDEIEFTTLNTNKYFYTMYLNQLKAEVRFYLGYILHKIMDVDDASQMKPKRTPLYDLLEHEFAFDSVRIANDLKPYFPTSLLQRDYL